MVLAPKDVPVNLPTLSNRLSLRWVPSHRIAGTAIALTFAGLGLVGCSTGDVVMMATIAGGEKIRVPLARGGPEMTNEAGVQINTANFTLNPEKKIVYIFEFTDSGKRALRSVRVEDVSDEVAVKLVEQESPKLLATGQWHGEAEPLELSDPRLNWMATISNSLRVFRFTLTFSDGRSQVLHQGALYTAPLKAAVRQALGQKY